MGAMDRARAAGDDVSTTEPCEDGTTPLISVIMPFFNPDLAKLKRAIESVLASTYRMFELLLIDDGSTATDERAVQELCGDDRIKLVRCDHAGVSAARNTGMELAQGEWITFIDADDDISPFFLNEALFLALRYSADLIVGRVDRTASSSARDAWSERGRGIAVDLRCGCDEIDRLRDEVLGRFQRRGSAGIPLMSRAMHAKLLRASIAQRCQFNTSLSIGEDLIFNFEVLEFCDRVAITDGVWYRYGQSGDSVLHSADASKWTRTIDRLSHLKISDRFSQAHDSLIAFTAIEAVERLMDPEAPWTSRNNTLELLSTPFDGYFSRTLHAGYRLPVWRRIAYLLAGHHHPQLAFAVLVVKREVKRILNAKGASHA